MLIVGDTTICWEVELREKFSWWWGSKSKDWLKDFKNRCVILNFRVLVLLQNRREGDYENI